LLFTAAIGLFIARIGKQRALTIEYIGLIISFVGYAFVEPEKLAATLCVTNHRRSL
jgi:hypothetical protein